MKDKYNPENVTLTINGTQAQPTTKAIQCSACHSEDVIVDTGVCSIPKGRDRDRDLLRYQTLCSDCGAIGSVELTEVDLKAIIRKEDLMVEELLVSGGV